MRKLRFTFQPKAISNERQANRLEPFRRERFAAGLGPAAALLLTAPPERAIRRKIAKTGTARNSRSETSD